MKFQWPPKVTKEQGIKWENLEIVIRQFQWSVEHQKLETHFFAELREKKLTFFCFCFFSSPLTSTLRLHFTIHSAHENNSSLSYFNLVLKLQLVSGIWTSLTWFNGWILGWSQFSLLPMLLQKYFKSGQKWPKEIILFKLKSLKHSVVFSHCVAFTGWFRIKTWSSILSGFGCL